MPLEQQKPHIILLTYYFPPSGAVGGVRPSRFCKYLKRLGYTCDVVTASEQPPGGTPGVTCVPDRLGRFWEGKSQTSSPLGLAGHFERIIRRFVIPGCVGTVWAADASRCCLELARRRPGKEVVLLTTQPPIGAVFAGLLAVLQGRLPWIADFRDPISFGSEFTRWPRVTEWILILLESMVHRHAAAVIANTERAAEVWRARFPWARGRIHVVWNGFDPEDRLQALPLIASQVRTIIHAGELYEGRNPNLVLEALARLRARGEPAASAVRIMLVGATSHLAGIDSELFDSATHDGWLDLRAPVPQREAHRLVAQSGFLLLVQPQSRVQVPAKLFSYIFIGRPILALVPPGSSVEYVLANAGVPYRCVYTSDSPAEADRKLLEFLRLPSDPVPFSSWFETHFNACRQTGQLAAIIQSIVDLPYL